MSEDYHHHNEPTAADRESRLRVYCFQGLKRNFSLVWHSVFFNLSRIPKDLEIFTSNNEIYITWNVTESRKSFYNFWWSVTFWKKGAIHIPPFHASCVGISTVEPYALKLCWKVEPFRLIIFICGVLLFLKAKPLSRHIAFYYFVGVSVSLVASVVLAVLILYRFMPFRRGFYFLMFISSATIIVILQYVIRHIDSLLFERQTLLIGYVAVVTFLSCAFLRYFSSKLLVIEGYNRVQWGLQVIGILCIFFSSQISEVAFGISSLLLFFSYFPRSVIYRLRAYWHRWFPKQRRYYTNEEYREIVAETTRKSLEDLRDYCRSPECKSWKIVARLESPKRFAFFVEGDADITEEEDKLHNEAYPSTAT